MTSPRLEKKIRCLVLTLLFEFLPSWQVRLNQFRFRIIDFVLSKISYLEAEKFRFPNRFKKSYFKHDLSTRFVADTLMIVVTLWDSEVCW